MPTLSTNKGTDPSRKADSRSSTQPSVEGQSPHVSENIHHGTSRTAAQRDLRDSTVTNPTSYSPSVTRRSYAPSRPDNAFLFGEKEHRSSMDREREFWAPVIQSRLQKIFAELDIAGLLKRNNRDTSPSMQASPEEVRNQMETLARRSLDITADLVMNSQASGRKLSVPMARLVREGVEQGLKRLADSNIHTGARPDSAPLIDAFHKASLGPAGTPGVLASRVNYSAKLDNRLGIPENAQESLADIRGNNKAVWDSLVAKDPEAAQKLGKIWTVMRVDLSRDRGQELELLLPALDRDPSLLDKLSSVATAHTLFGRSADTMPRDAFEQVRREFLVDLVRSAIDPDVITQGADPMCASTAPLIPIVAELGGGDPSYLLHLGCDYALNGRVMTAGGVEMTMQSHYFDHGLKTSKGEVDSIKSVRRSAGWQMLLDGMAGMSGADPTAGNGLYANQYTACVQALRGKRTACALENGAVFVNKSGDAVSSSADGAHEVTRNQYLKLQLEKRKAGEAGGIPIDTLWNHAGRGEQLDQQHARHMLVAKNFETRIGADGTRAEYVVCQNPIGGFIDPASKGTGEARYYAPGTVLGNKDHFWFETGEGGTVYIRADVLDQHLQTVIVNYDETVAPENILQAEMLGTVEEQAPVIVPYDYVVSEVPRTIVEEHKPTTTSSSSHFDDEVPAMREYVPAHRQEQSGQPIGRPITHQVAYRNRNPYEWDGDALMEHSQPTEVSADQGGEFWDEERGTWASAPSGPQASPSRPVSVPDGMTTQRLPDVPTTIEQDLRLHESRVNPEMNETELAPRASSFSTPPPTTRAGSNLGGMAWNSGTLGPMKSSTADTSGWRIDKKDR